MSHGASPPMVIPAPASASRTTSAALRSERGGELAGEVDHARPPVRVFGEALGDGQSGVDQARRRKARAGEHPGEAAGDGAPGEARARFAAAVAAAVPMAVPARAALALAGPSGERGGRLAQAVDAAVVLDHRVGAEARRVALRRAGQNRLGRQAPGDHRGQDPLGGERLGEPQAVAAQEHGTGARLPRRLPANRAFQVARIEEVVGVPLHRLELRGRLGRDVAGGGEVRPRPLPGGAHLVRLDGSRADVQPVRLGDVPGIAAQIVVQQQLWLAVAPGPRAGYRRWIGRELVLLNADRSAGPRRGDHPRDRAIGAARTDQMARAQAGDRPEAVAVAHDVVDRHPQMQVSAASTQQEVVELEAPDEPAVAGDGPLLAAVADVAAAPLPQAAGVFVRRQRQRVPDRRRDPPSAQLDPRKLRAIDDGHLRPSTNKERGAGAASRASPDDEHIVDHAISKLLRLGRKSTRFAAPTATRVQCARSKDRSRDGWPFGRPRKTTNPRTEPRCDHQELPAGAVCHKPGIPVGPEGPDGRTPYVCTAGHHFLWPGALTTQQLNAIARPAAIAR